MKKKRISKINTLTKTKAFVDTAIGLHQISHKTAPFITCEALQEGFFVKIKFANLTDTHHFYEKFIKFLMSIKEK